MNSLFFALLAACCASLSNWLYRKNSSYLAGPQNSNGYLLFFYLFSFIFSLTLDRNIWTEPVSWIIIAIGGAVGLLNIVLMLLTAKALKKGPAGLTFAFQNASAVFPGIFLFLLFGSNLGFSCSIIQILGIIFVLFGLFLGAKKESGIKNQTSFKWLKYCLSGFAVQILALTLIQGRCILFGAEQELAFLSNIKIQEAEDIWFMPGMFGTAFCSQLIVFLYEKRRLNLNETIYGCFGGLSNFGSTFCLLLATKFAMPFEKTILFPCFAVATILLCNAWANRLYKEKFNLAANSMCSLGIFLGMFAEI